MSAAPALAPPSPAARPIRSFGPRHRYVVEMLRQAAALTGEQRARLAAEMGRRRDPAKPRQFNAEWQTAHGHAMDAARREGHLVAVGHAWDAAKRLLADVCRAEPPRVQEAVIAAASGELLGVCLADVLDPADVYTLSGPWYDAIVVAPAPDGAA